MTISYDFDGDLSVIKSPRVELSATIYLADTTSIHPEEWVIY